MTDTQRKAMQLALEALVACADYIPCNTANGEIPGDLAEYAIDALREALAVPVVGHVAWLYTLEYGATVVNTTVSLHQLNYPFGVCGADFARANDDGFSYVRQTPLYTSPTPADVPLLTDEQIARQQSGT